MAPKFSESNRVQFCVGLKFAMWDGFCMNMTNLGGFRVVKCSWVLAGANFNAWRRRAVYCEVNVACRDGMFTYLKRKQFTAETI